MNQNEIKELCQSEVDNRIDRMHYLCDNGRAKDAAALYEEINQWIIDGDNIEIMSIDYLNGII